MTPAISSVHVYNFQDPYDYVGAYQALTYLVSQISLLNFCLACFHCLLLILIAWSFLSGCQTSPLQHQEADPTSLCQHLARDG